MDDLPPGLALVSVDAINATPAVSTSIEGGFDAVRTGAVVGPGGFTVEFDFGTLANSATDSSAQTITIDYTVVVLNVAGNQIGKDSVEPRSVPDRLGIRLDHGAERQRGHAGSQHRQDGDARHG